jgi:hypothetical protein
MKKLTFLAFAAISLFNCENPTPLPNDNPSGGANITIKMGKVGALAKRTDIEFSRLCIALSATGEATIYDTIPISGNGATSVNKTYEDLASLKTWTLKVNTIDIKDSTIHAGSIAFDVRPRQTADVTVDLPAQYSMLKANFSPIRDSVTRCELLLDGVVIDDSSFGKQSALGTSIQLAFDYLPVGVTKRIKMDVYGEMWGFDTLLYTSDTVITSVAGENKSYNIALKWVGPKLPPPGQASMNVILGAVGTVSVNGELQPNTVTVDFWMSVDDFGTLLIDSQTVASYDGYPWGQAYGTVTLTEGWHDIDIVYKNRWGSNALILFQKFTGDTVYSDIPKTHYRSSNDTGVVIPGLKAEYFDLSGNPSTTVYGEGPIHHQYASDGIHIVYQGEYGLWANVYDGWGKFEERLSGQIYIGKTLNNK